ncbi:MAG: RT0821/Lpp0805 family surface protein [Rhodospirillaceae bacterium]
MSVKRFGPAPAMMLVLALAVSACETGGTKQTIGTLGGAAAGGLLGSQFGHGAGGLAMTAAGTLLGALVGSEVGRSLDTTDKMQVQRAQQQAYMAPVGEAINWNNPQSGNSGTITTLRDGRTPNGSYCREFQQSIVVGGRSERAMGTACQQPDGTWKIVQ